MKTFKARFFAEFILSVVEGLRMTSKARFFAALRMTSKDNCKARFFAALRMTSKARFFAALRMTSKARFFAALRMTNKDNCKARFFAEFILSVVEGLRMTDQKFLKTALRMAGFFVMLLTLPACSTAKEKTAAPVKTQTVQETVVAGAFYPDDPVTLKADVRKFIGYAQKKEIKGHLMGLVAPHAGYRYSGPVAGWAYKQLEGRTYTTVVVLAPSHRAPVYGAAVSTRDVYATPLGNIPIDTTLTKKFAKEYGVIADDQTPYQMEHALEVQLPFLQTLLGNFKLVPLIVGAHDKGVLDRIADALNKELPGDDVLFIASSDLSHYKSYDDAARADTQTLAFITKGDPEAFWAAENAEKVLACGAAPIYVLMKLAQMRGGGDINLLQYLNSGDTAGDKSNVVGYGALAVLTREDGRQVKDEKAGFTLSEKQKGTLLKLARDTVVAHVTGKKLPSIDTNDPVLKENGAAFVTLKKNGELRGCIGHIVAREPLIKTVRAMAVAASSEDPRFPPVRPDELKDITIEVSVLTPPEPLTNPLEVRVGTDGLLIQRDYNRGVLLPQVPTEQGWNKDEYLRGICQKAGMEPTCWKSATLQKFQAIVFGE